MLFFGVLFVALSSCGVPSRIDCSQIFTGAVCGIDGNTYKNDCYAEQAGVFVFVNGDCPFEECSGSVCGNDGKTYASDCFAVLSGISVYLTGTCPFPCSGPVCGDNGTTYVSDCFAVLSGISQYEPGECPPAG